MSGKEGGKSETERHHLVRDASYGHPPRLDAVHTDPGRQGAAPGGGVARVSHGDVQCDGSGQWWSMRAPRAADGGGNGAERRIWGYH